MIICSHNCEFDLLILDGFKIVDPLLHINYSVNLYFTKILFLDASVKGSVTICAVSFARLAIIKAERKVRGIN